MKKAIVKEVLSAYASWKYEELEEGFEPKDFDFDEIVEIVHKDYIDHKKYK